MHATLREMCLAKWSAWLSVAAGVPCVVGACASFSAADPSQGPAVPDAALDATTDALGTVDADAQASRYASLFSRKGLCISGA